MKLLQNLYFRYYQLMVDVGNGDIANFAATLFMSMIICVNILTLVELLEMLGTSVVHLSKFTGIVGLACIFTGLYFLLVYNGKSAAIKKSHAGETKKNKLRGRLALIAYIILSIGLLLSTWLFLAFRNQGRI